MKTINKKNKVTTKKYFVYILECKDKTFYCGSTNNLKKRIHAHNNLKSGAKYTSGRRPVKLVYSEKLRTFAEMRKREGEIKRMNRTAKHNLFNHK